MKRIKSTWSSSRYFASSGTLPSFTLCRFLFRMLRSRCLVLPPVQSPGTCNAPRLEGSANPSWATDCALCFSSSKLVSAVPFLPFFGLEENSEASLPSGPLPQVAWEALPLSGPWPPGQASDAPRRADPRATPAPSPESVPCADIFVNSRKKLLLR